jgi:DNA-binding NarL/FixJ family response regulator
MRILLADDHDLLRDTLKSYLEALPLGISVVTARSLDEALDVADAETELDVILLDIDMPGMNGLSGLVSARARNAVVPVAILSGLSDPRIIVDAFRRGAAGYIPKAIGARAMVSAVQVILSGDRYVPAMMLDQMDVVLSSSERVSEPDAQEGLTADESSILEMLRRGASNKEIARTLGTEEYTVKYHMRGLFKKLGAKNRTHAAMIASERAES